MKKIFFAISTIAFSLFSLTACLDFDDPGDEMSHNQINTDDKIAHGNPDSLGFRYVPTKVGFAAAKDSLRTHLGQMISAQYAMRGGKDNGTPEAHAYQYQFSLGVDNFCGYFTAPQNFDGRLKSTLYINDSFNSGPNGHFLIVKNALVPLLNSQYVDSIPIIKAMALLLYDYSAQEQVDLYGALPYTDYLNNKQENPFDYDKGQDIYLTIIDHLDSINAAFEYFEKLPLSDPQVASYVEGVTDIIQNDPGIDYITKTFDIDAWRRLANSLKLRMAMHAVNVMPDKAQKWAEEAVKAGVVDDVQYETGQFPLLFGFENPLNTISNSWNDTRLGASFESILRSLNHPYLEYLWEKNSGNLYDDETSELTLAEGTRVVGLRAGIQMFSTQVYGTNHRCAYSALKREVIQGAPLYLMKLSEVDFLRAEGAIRGWAMGGSAQSFYERGIQYAYVDDRDNVSSVYTSAMKDYMSQERATPFTYVDPMNKKYNAESVTKIGVKWNDGDDFETKLEKIITQKYIAGFPYSFEAWTDIRRTGYPKVFPILNVRDGDRSLKVGEMIRRMPFPGFENAKTLADINSSGVKALGGEDLQATRIWWDTTK